MEIKCNDVDECTKAFAFSAAGTFIESHSRPVNAFHIAHMKSNALVCDERGKVVELSNIAFSEWKQRHPRRLTVQQTAQDEHAINSRSSQRAQGYQLASQLLSES